MLTEGFHIFLHFLQAGARIVQWLGHICSIHILSNL